MKGSDLE